MNKQKKAFTLVELIVVITILAILGTIAFISLQWYSKDARDSIRISDVSNMKTSLELFHLDAGKYPLPDDNEIVDYGTEILWYQWDFWTTVISSLSRSMSEVPTDPLTDKKYVFSVANNKNEFEILSLLEWDSLTLNSLSQTNAASLVVTPKVDWNYNRVFIKTANYIVPIPSLITSESLSSTMTLDSNNIKSQVVNAWENIPEQWNVISNTWALTWLALSVYTWSIDINTSNSEKEIVIGKIKDAYTASVLANNDIYEYILNTSGTEEIVSALNAIVLNNTTTEVTTTAEIDPYSSCIWVNNPTPFAASTTYGSCDTADTVVCDGVWSGYTVASCNVWTNTAPIAHNDSNWYWELFQWWNNAWMRLAWTSPTQISITATWSTYSSSTFIYDTSDWNTTQNDNLWWNTPWTDVDRKWPCEVWYHVPSEPEWSWLHTAWWWAAGWLSMASDLKMAMTGRLYMTNASLNTEGLVGYFWSSSPNGTKAHYMYLGSTEVYPSFTSDRAYGYSVRCFKN
jgi:prepilin-type N-terminal cleavage/methylation domain-containing protein